MDMPSREGIGRGGGGEEQELLDAGHLGRAELQVGEASGRWREGREQTPFHNVAYQALLR